MFFLVLFFTVGYLTRFVRASLAFDRLQPNTDTKIGLTGHYGDFSLSVWARLTWSVADTFNTVLTLTDASSPEQIVVRLSFVKDSAGVIKLERKAGSKGLIGNVDAALVDGQWVFLAVTCLWSGTDVEFYLNDAKLGSVLGGHYNLASIPSPTRIYLGSSGPQGLAKYSSLEGHLDELLFFKQALDAPSVAAIKNNGAVQWPASSSLKGEYRMTTSVNPGVNTVARRAVSSVTAITGPITGPLSWSPDSAPVLCSGARTLTFSGEIDCDRVSTSSPTAAPTWIPTFAPTNSPSSFPGPGSSTEVPTSVPTAPPFAGRQPTDNPFMTTTFDDIPAGSRSAPSSDQSSEGPSPSDNPIVLFVLAGAGGLLCVLLLVTGVCLVVRRRSGRQRRSDLLSTSAMHHRGQQVAPGSVGQELRHAASPPVRSRSSSTSTGLSRSRRASRSAVHATSSSSASTSTNGSSGHQYYRPASSRSKSASRSVSRSKLTQQLQQPPPPAAGANVHFYGPVPGPSGQSECDSYVPPQIYAGITPAAPATQYQQPDPVQTSNSPSVEHQNHGYGPAPTKPSDHQQHHQQQQQQQPRQ